MLFNRKLIETGERLFTVRVASSWTEEDVAHALAYEAVEYGDTLPETAAAVRRRIRDFVSSRGDVPAWGCLPWDDLAPWQLGEFEEQLSKARDLLQGLR